MQEETFGFICRTGPDWVFDHRPFVLHYQHVQEYGVTYDSQCGICRKVFREVYEGDEVVVPGDGVPEGDRVDSEGAAPLSLPSGWGWSAEGQLPVSDGESDRTEAEGELQAEADVSGTPCG